MFRHEGYLELTVFYHATVNAGGGTPLASVCCRLQRRSGESHENLPADDADRYHPCLCTFKFCPETAVEIASAVRPRWPPTGPPAATAPPPSTLPCPLYWAVLPHHRAGGSRGCPAAPCH